MTLEYLTGLGISEEASEAILQKHAEAVSKIKAEAEEKRIYDKYDSVLRAELTAHGAKNLKACMAVLDYGFDGADFDGAPEGLSSAVEKLTHDMPYLFGAEKEASRVFCSFVGIVPAEAVDDASDKDSLSYSEYMKLYRN